VPIVFENFVALTKPINQPIMFYDTGAVSFWLYAILLLILFVAMFFVVRLIIRSTADENKINRITELLKYCIVTIGIATVTPIITNLFAERDQDIKELNYFDKYTATITMADGTGRYQLARYLAHVAPSGELKDGWKAYYELIKDEPQQYRAAKMEKLGLDTLATLRSAQVERLEVLDSIIESYEKPILTREQFDVVYGTNKPAAPLKK
jgi:hypothetical protein